MAPREPTHRAKTSKCVRLNDLRGFDCKFNKSNFRSDERRDLYYFFVKCYEQVLRERPPGSVATRRKFQRFRRFSESSFLRPLSEGFGNFTFEQKRGELQKVFDELEEAAAGGSQDVDMQVNNPDNMQVDEGRAGAIPGIVNMLLPPIDASLQNVARNQLGNPQGWPPPSPDDLYVHPYELNQFMSKFMRRASRFPNTWPEFEELEQFMSFADKLDSMEELELSEALKDDSNTLLRSRQEEIYAQLQEDLLSEDPQDQLTKPWTEGIIPGPSYSQASGFGEDVECGVKDTVTTMPHAEQDGLLPNPGISEALEVVPRLTGHLRINIADIHPQVIVNNMAGDLQYQPTMEHVGPQASHPQVYDPGDMQSGGENLTTVPFVGRNNYTSPIVAMECFVSAEPPAVNEQVLWTEEHQNRFDTPFHESLPNLQWSTYFQSSPDWLEFYSNTDTLPV